MAALDIYTGPWTRREAAHLLRRACYGATSAQLDAAVSDGLQKTVSNLLEPRPLPNPPVDQNTGLTWVDGGEGYDPTRGEFYYNLSTKTWWIGLMLESPLSITEKLTLFWSNHFATEATVVAQAIYTYKMLSFLREHALGNFRDLVRQVTIEEAMLVYLNGNTNTKGNPNENYARELQELFTIGKGLEAAPGDYTNYTEQDVQAAARVLTGWRVDRRTRSTVFQAGQHDTTSKQFSHRYQNTVIQGRSGVDGGNQELDDLLTMILRQPATPEYIVGKLYRWFVNSDITEDVQTNVIEPLAQEFGTNFEVKPILQKLLLSQHLFSNEIFGCQLRSPADLVVGTLRSIPGFTLPPTSDYNNRYRVLFSLHSAMSAQQMDLLEPPSVAGWTAYYQQPGYYREWLTTATLPQRNGFTDALKTPIRLGDTRKPMLDTVAFVNSLHAPGDALAMIDEINELLFATPFTETTRMKLAEEVLMDGGRYYEWTDVWEAYKANPSQANTNKVRTNLDRLFTYLFRMAEYQLY